MFEQFFYYGTGVISFLAAAVFSAGVVVLRLPEEWEDDDEYEP